MNNKIVVWVVVILALLFAGMFFLFRDGTEEFAEMKSDEVMSDTEMMVPAPGFEDVDEMMVEDGAMMEEDAMMDDEGDATITYTESGFSPAPLSVAQGTTVTFVNESGRDVWPASAIHPTHTVYDGTSLSEHCPDLSGIAFDVCGGIAPGGSWSFTFTKAGEWTYHDHLNPRNFGKVIVQ